MTDNSFKVVSSKYNGNRGTLINRNIDLTQSGVDTAHLTIPDLCGIKFVFETDEEIDKVVKWIENDYFEKNFDKSRSLRIRDFREDKGKDGCFIQPGYKAVHVVCSHKMSIDDQTGVDYMEIQLMTSQQEIINKTTREAYGVSLRQRVQNNRTDLVN